MGAGKLSTDMGLKSELRISLVKLIEDETPFFQEAVSVGIHSLVKLR